MAPSSIYCIAAQNFLTAICEELVPSAGGKSVLTSREQRKKKVNSITANG